MKKVFIIALFAVVAFCGVAATASAQSTNADLAVTATVANRVYLDLGAAAVNFPDRDPETVPSIPGSATITITAKVRAGAADNTTLTALAQGDLVSGSDAIGIDNITWACGAGGGYLASGTMNKTTAQNVASFTGSGSHAGATTYALANSWAYATGAYSATIRYTLAIQ